MKKVLALVMCVAMIACFAVIASADTAATFTVATVEGVKGDTVKIAIDISDNTKIGALGLDVTYDEAYLEPVQGEDEFGDPADVIAGAASGAVGALLEGSIAENPIKVASATTRGYRTAGAVVILTFKVLEDIPEGEIAAVTAEVTSIENADDPGVIYDVTVIEGGVKAPEPVEVIDDEPSEVEVPATPTTVTETDTKNPETGDAAALAVAAGLCAVMAAAFVITKKVND